MNDVMQGRWTLLHVIGLLVWQKHVKFLSLCISLSLVRHQDVRRAVSLPKHSKTSRNPAATLLSAWHTYFINVSTPIVICHQHNLHVAATPLRDSLPV